MFLCYFLNQQSICINILDAFKNIKNFHDTLRNKARITAFIYLLTILIVFSSNLTEIQPSCNESRICYFMRNENFTFSDAQINSLLVNATNSF